MNKSDVKDTIKREIDYRKALIDQCQRGVLIHFDTPEKREKYIEQQEISITEAEWIASKLHIKL